MMAMATATASMACVRCGEDLTRSMKYSAPGTFWDYKTLIFGPRGENEIGNVIISGTRSMHTGISSSTHGCSESTVAHVWILNCIGLYGLPEDDCHSIYMRSGQIQSQFYTV
jgi:hypothetical protein